MKIALSSVFPIYNFSKSILTFGIVLSIILSSCGKGKDSDADTDTFIPTEMPDIVDSVKTDTVKREDGTPYVHFENKDAAVRFIEASQNPSRYKQGIIWKILQDNLEYAEKLLNNTTDRFLIVDKGSMRVIVYDKYGVEETNFGICCARNFGTKHHKGDSRTPEGFFSVEGVYDSTDWLFTNDNGYTSPVKGQFGPRFIRLKVPNTSQIGLHGTVAPGSIGGRSSHGCIRLTNDNILKLVKLVKKGMPVIVSPGPRDRAVNEREGYHIYSVKTGYEEKMFKNIPDTRVVNERKPSNSNEEGETDVPTEQPEENNVTLPAESPASPESKTASPESPAQPVPVPTQSTGAGTTD